MKVVINRRFGGFRLSECALKRLIELGMTQNEVRGVHCDDPIIRTDPRLVQVVEELGGKANGEFAKLGIVEIPDGADITIEQYGGLECVVEVHRTWH